MSFPRDKRVAEYCILETSEEFVKWQLGHPNAHIVNAHPLPLNTGPELRFGIFVLYNRAYDEGSDAV